MSYARADGAEGATVLRARLAADGLPVWQDLTDLQGGDDWWLQIVEAMARVEYLVLVLTDGALRSQIVQREWQTARAQGVMVLPVTLPGRPPSEPLPRWLRVAHWYDLERDQARLLADLHRTPVLRRVPFMVEDLPPDFVPRGEEFERIVALLVEPGRHEPVAITAALRGAGGYGKTTLARAVCHDPRIRDAYGDGILWITLGERPTRADVIDRVCDLIETLQGERPGYASLEAACARLREALSERDLLMVIDDVWQPEHVAPFLSGGKRCTRLITTRLADTVPTTAVQVPVDQMRPVQAVQLLGHGLAPTETDPGVLRRLAARLGEWPLLLRLVNGVLHQRLRLGREGIASALAWVHQALDKRGVVAFDSRNPVERNRAVALTIGVSLDQLSAEEAERFLDLAVFPEDLDVPVEVVARLWNQRGHLDPMDAQELCLRLAAISLIQRLDLAEGTLRLHDAVRHFAGDSQGAAALQARHADLLAALAGDQAPHRAALDDGYLLRHLAHHLAGAGRGDELASAVKSPPYASARLARHKSWSLLEDVVRASDAAPADSELKELANEIARFSHVLDGIQDPAELLDTLRARMAPVVASARTLDGDSSGPWLIAERPFPGLHPDLRRTLSIQAETLRCVAFSPAGDWLLCGAASGRAFVVDVQTGRIRAATDGGSRINGCAVSPSGRWFVTVSEDGHLASWDADSGTVREEPRPASTRLLCCAIDPGELLIATGGGDNRVRLWNASGGPAKHILHGHVASVTACAFSPDGRLLASVGADGRCCLWDVEAGTLSRVLQPAGLPLSCCAVSDDGPWVVTGGLDGWLRVWDRVHGTCVHALHAHRGAVRACAVALGWILSVGTDGATRMWHTGSGADHRVGEPQEQVLRALAVDPSGRAFAIAGEQGEAQLWDLALHRAGQAEGWAPRPADLLALGPFGDCFLLGGRNKLHELWRAPWNTPETLDPPPDGPLVKARISPDGAQVAGLTQAGEVWLWRTAGGGRRLASYEEPVAWCSFTADASHLVWQPAAGPAEVWDLHQDRWLRRLMLEQVPHDAAAGPGLAWIAGANEEGAPFMFDGSTGAIVQAVSGGASPQVQGAGSARLSAALDTIACCAFSPDGQHLVAAGDDGRAVVWDLRTGLRRQTCGEHAHWVWRAVLAGDGSVHTACWDGSVQQWAPDTGQRLRSMDAHTGPVVDLSESDDGTLLATASFDGTVAVWHARDGRQRRRWRVDPVPSCCLLANGGHHVVAGTVQGRIFVFELATGDCRAQASVHEGQVNRMMPAGRDDRVLTIGDDGSAAWLDARSGATLERWRVSDTPLIDAAVSADGRCVAVLDARGQVALWNPEAGAPELRLQAATDLGPATACAMSRDGTRLAVALGVRLRVFRIADLSLVHELPRCVKWEVRGATKGAAQTVVDGQAVWLAQADEPLWQARHARGHGELGALAPTSPRAELRAAVLLDHDNGPDVLTLRVPGREPLALHEPPGHCVGSACDPTGRYAALAYADGTLRVCDFERRSWVATIHTGQELRGCAWLDEGRRLVAFSTLGPLWLRWCASARDE